MNQQKKRTDLLNHERHQPSRTSTRNGDGVHNPGVNLISPSDRYLG